jgi:uncharacterized membrane protein
MKNATSTQYAVIPQGGVKEELWELQDIERLCRAGKLPPNSLIFVPEANEWKKLVDTNLADCFEKSDTADSSSEAVPPQDAAYREQYDAVIQQLHANPSDIGLRLNAADLALAMGKTDWARDHYQEALDLNPYHPRVAQEAKRNLPPSKSRTLKHLEKPPQVWDDPASVFMYPHSRGPLYLALPAAVLFGMFWSVWTIVPAVLLVGFWSMETMRSAARGEKRAPVGGGLASEPIRRIAQPLAVTAMVAFELCAALAAIAGILVATRLSSESNIYLLVVKSPVLTVLAWTAVAFYFPAAFMLSVSNAARLKDAANPKTVAAAIRLMEAEYLLSASLIAALVYAVWGVGSLLGDVSWIDRAFYATAIMYIMLAGSFVFGRILARFRDDMEKRVLSASSGAK